MRIYNPTLGRFLGVDPVSAKFPWLTSYQFASNRPILAKVVAEVKKHLRLRMLL